MGSVELLSSTLDGDGSPAELSTVVEFVFCEAELRCDFFFMLP